MAGRHSGQLVTSIGATLIVHITHARKAPYQCRAQTKTMQRKPITTALRATGAVTHRATETADRASDEGAQSLPTLAREPHRARRARGMPRQAVLRERARPGVRGRHSRTAGWRRGGRRRAGGGRGRAGEIGRGAAVTSESWMQRQARARVSADAGTHACTLWAPARELADARGT